MLHKTSYVSGFHVMATDGEIGHVDNFLFDDSWTIRQLVVDISNWIGGKSVLIPPAAVTKVDSPEKKVHVRLTREEVKNSPALDTAEIELIETLPPVIM
jgi:PRC-barrel domain